MMELAAIAPIIPTVDAIVEPRKDYCMPELFEIRHSDGTTFWQVNICHYVMEKYYTIDDGRTVYTPRLTRHVDCHKFTSQEMARWFIARWWWNNHDKEL